MKTNSTPSRSKQSPTESSLFRNSHKDWRDRARSHYLNVLDDLRSAGDRGITSEQLYSNRSRYGVSPRNRISEARANGFKIETVRISASAVRYILHTDPRPDWYIRRISFDDYTTQRAPRVVPRDSTTQSSLFDEGRR